MARQLILVVDDEKSVRQALRIILRSSYEVMEAASVAEAQALLGEHEFDLVLLDICLGGDSGLEVLRFLNASGLSRPVICISGEASYEQAIEAYKLGSVDFLDKPLSQQKLMFAINKCLIQHLAVERQQAYLGLQTQRTPQILGSSPLLQNLREQAKLIAATDSRVLILGETGTGKEALAGTIHHDSRRARGPFGVVDCGSLPASLMESCLFGHRKGAFTGATHDQAGRLECADGGTLFLDELGELSLEGQNRLLRFIETGEVQRLGSTKVIKTNVRIMAATSRNLEQLIQQGQFRSDLFYRLNVFTLRTPALRDIASDIPLICQHYLTKFCRELGRPPLYLGAGDRMALQQHSWPGNIRELRNFAERAAILGLELAVSGLQNEWEGAALPRSQKGGGGEAPPLQPLLPLRQYRQGMEKDYLRYVLEQTSGNVTKAARILEIDRVSLHQKIALYKLERR